MSQQILSTSIKKANIPQKREQTMTSTTTEDLCKPNDSLHNRFTIIKKLTAGTFGQIYVAKDNMNKDLNVAIKVESSVGSVVQLPLEVMVMKKYQGKEHGATLVSYGCEGGKNYIVMQLLGPNLKTLRCRCPNNEMRFSGSTIVRILAHCLESLRDLHGINFLHRDVKPANFAVGIGIRKDIIYILDFGLSRRYRGSDGTLRPARPVAGVRGTLKYCSPATLKHKDLSRGDDLISLFYVFIDLYTNNLPWAGATDYAKTLEMKEKYDIIWLTGRLPSKFKTIAQHIKSLKFFDDPNYELLLKLVNDIMQENNIMKNAPWDWEDNFVNLNRNLIDVKDSGSTSTTSRSTSSKTKKEAA